MTSQHTPGPWIAEDQSGKVPFWAIYGADHSAIVYGTLRGPEELAANARLIAEAPAMLEALRKVCKALNGRIHSNDALSAVAECAAILARIDGEAA